MKKPIYMDNHATTPVDPRVLEAMLPFFSERFGNAASRTHPFGWEAEEAVDRARAEIASLINAKPKEVVFTSGATESDNLAIKGILEFYRDRGDHIVTCATEHNAVLDTCRSLERRGMARVTYLPVDRQGRVDPDEVRRALTARTVLISIMYANNEIGTVHPIRDIGRVAGEARVLFHCDGAQAVGKVPVDVDAAGIDLLSVSAHKIYGPKGVGALVVRSRTPRVRLAAQVEGGGHERGLRSGTLNVPAIVGFGCAARICRDEMSGEAERLRAMRDRLHGEITRQLEEVYLNGHPVERLPGNLNLSFAYVEAESLLMALNREVALSSGAACTSARLEPSHVLRALGVGESRLQSSVRFGLGRFNTEEEVDYVAERVVDSVRRLREISPLYRAATGGAARRAS